MLYVVVEEVVEEVEPLLLLEEVVEPLLVLEQVMLALALAPFFLVLAMTPLLVLAPLLMLEQVMLALALALAPFFLV